MAKALSEYYGDVVYMGPITTRMEWFGMVIDGLARKILNKRYDFQRSKWFARRLAVKVRAKLGKESFDYIVAPAAANAIAYLDNVNVPIVFVSDTTFALMIEYYQGFSNYLSMSVRDGNALAKLAMERSDLVLFPSEWAAASARDDYCIDSSKIHVIPFGANIDSIPSREIALNRKRSSKCKMLMLGVDWQRKGGDIAFETLIALESNHGIKAELTVCGCNPPMGLVHDRMIIIEFLDKEIPGQAVRLAQLYMETDYLLLPTRSECYGVVFCEASSYGVPSIATDTGGVSSVVTDGKNGYLLSESARGNEYAALIAGIESNNSRYEELCVSSRNEYEAKLNWDSWAKQFVSLTSAL